MFKDIDIIFEWIINLKVKIMGLFNFNKNKSKNMSLTGSSQEMEFVLRELGLPTTPENIKGFQDIFMMSGSYDTDTFKSFLKSKGYI